MSKYNDWAQNKGSKVTELLYSLPVIRFKIVSEWTGFVANYETSLISHHIVRFRTENVPKGERSLGDSGWIESGLVHSWCVCFHHFPEGHGGIAGAGQGELHLQSCQGPVWSRSMKKKQKGRATNHNYNLQLSHNHETTTPTINKNEVVHCVLL